MPDPTFLVIGAQKSGTTWLYQTMKQHPEVFATDPKGLYFFDKAEHFSRGLSWYRAQFAGAQGHGAAGEFTPNYFWQGGDDAPQDGLTMAARVREAVPEVKVIVSLREPVSRAVSAYYHHIRAGRIRPRERLLSVVDRFGIASMGFYDEHLSEWLEAFPREQVLVLIYEEDIGKAGDGLTRVFEFVGVDPSFEPRFTGYRYNSRKSHLYMRIQDRAPRLAKLADVVLPGVVKKNSERWKIPVHDHERRALAELYAPHNARLSEMLGRPLPW